MQDCAVAYVEDRDHFKDTHGYIEGTFINRAKQAALMVRVIMDRKPIIVADTAPDTIHRYVANEAFALRYALNLLRVRLTDIPLRVQDDILFTFRNNEGLGPKLLILAMHVIEEAYCRIGWCRRLVRRVRAFCPGG
ncbi:MAG: hypothetical protein H7841_01150 [Magnetospirillum sp. WYHS-4]